MNTMNSTSLAARPAVFKLVFLALILALILTLGIGQAEAKATAVTTNFSEDTQILVYIPCALGGTGEFVLLSGPLHILFSTTVDNNGGFKSKYHFQPQGISGTGEISGDHYQATGVTQETIVGRVGFEDTYVNNFKIVGQGPGNNYMVHENLHITVNPNGTLTAFVDNFSVDCKSTSYP